jgi:endonuclease-3
VIMPASTPRISAPQRIRAQRLLAALDAHYPDAHCELHHTTAHELLIATILSAQTTDVAVNKVTPALFSRFPTPKDYVDSTPEEIEPFLRTIGLFRNKSKSVHAAMTTLVEKFNGQVPRTMDELLTLRGVARKTANVVLGNVFKLNEGVVVDTHVERLSKRLSLAPQDANVAKVERYLMSLFPRERWCDLSHMLIFHGRRACAARPPGGCCRDHPICQEFGQRCELERNA